MAAPTLFRVLTEFRFDIANAVIGSQTLTRQVDKISGAANSALFSLTRLSIGFAASFGLAPTGVVGLLAQGVIASDNFNRSAIQFTSILSGNIENLTGDLDSFNQRLAFSKQFLLDLNKIAFEFGLPAEQLQETAKNLAGALIPLGVAGKNLINVRELSRSLLKAAPILNIDVGNVQNQLINALLGGATLQGQLFRRLVAETTALQPFAGRGGTRRFNELAAAQRFNLLSKAFNQFTQDADVLAASANTLSGVFNKFAIITKGALSIFKPLGDVVMPVLVKVANQFLDVLNTKGRKTFENLAKLLAPIVSDPKRSLITLLQFRDLSGDVGKATTIVGIALAVFHIKEFIKFAKALGPVLKTAITGAGAAAAGGGAAAGAGFFAGSIFGRILASMRALLRPSVLLSSVLTFLRFAITKIAIPITLLVGVFQIFSRAAAKATVGDVLRIPALLERISGLMVRFRTALSTLFEPFVIIVEVLSDALVPLFSRILILEFFVSTLEGVLVVVEKLALAFILFQGTLNGIIAIITEFTTKLFDRDFQGLAATDFGKIFDDAVKSVLEDKLDPTTGNLKDLSVQSVTNIDKIEIRNDFKERIEPDRVAFALVEQLTKLGQNPLGTRGRSLRPIEGQ